MIAKFTCRNCSTRLEFDEEHVGEIVVCPNCGFQTTLYIPPQEQLKPGAPGSFSSRRTRWQLGVALAFGAIVVPLICYHLYCSHREYEHAVAAFSHKPITLAERAAQYASVATQQ